MINLDSLIMDASSFVKSEFNLNLNKSKLKSYSSGDWKTFCKVNDFNIFSSGLFVPSSYSAYVRDDSSFLTSNVFHELFGHGLFVEHSKIGKQLVDIIEKGGDEKGFLYDEVDFKKQFFGVAERNIDNYEGFAVWFEALLCQETGNDHVWNLKKDGLQKDYAELFELFTDFEDKLSRFGLMSQMGFPKFYDNEKVLDVTKRFYGSSFDNVEFVILYGSKKPESDIDLCIISTNPSSQYFNGWLDIAELNKEDFKKRFDNLDIALSDAMFSGKLIYGNENLFNQLKQKINKMSISQEMIKYNLKKSKLQKQYLSSYSNNSRLRELCLSYIDSFSQNAKQLSLGNKVLTYDNLKKLYLR